MKDKNVRYVKGIIGGNIVKDKGR